MTTKLARLLELAIKAENDDGWNCLTLDEHKEFDILVQQLEKVEEFSNQIYLPYDENHNVICYNGSWYVKTNAGNMQTAREMLVKRGRRN